MIGVDIIKVERIERFTEKHGPEGLQRFLHDHEIAMAKTSKSIAGYWAAKEAIAKALGCGIGEELGFLDITITLDQRGAPHFVLPEGIIRRHHITDTSLSISHDGEYAVAVAAIETKVSGSSHPG